MKKEDVCIILINYNSSKDTIACLRSIELHSKIKPFLIVVDNASVEEVDLEEVLSFYNNHKVIYSEENIGFGKANNLAIDWVFSNLETNFIFILNNDTIFSNDVVSTLKSNLSSKEYNYGVATPRILFYHNPDLAWYDGGFLSEWRFGPVINNFNKAPDENNKPYEVTFLSGCAMFFKTDVLKKIRGFHPIFFMYEEDVEMCYRLKENNVVILYVPEALILHKEFGSQKQDDAWFSAYDKKNKNALKNFYNFNKNRLIVFFMHGNVIKNYKFLIYFPIYLLKNSLILFLNGKFSVVKVLFKIVSNAVKEYKNYFKNELA